MLLSCCLLITPTSPKSEFTRELKALLENPCPAELPESTLKTVVVIDCWKVSHTEGLVEFEPLRNYHEEADDRIMYHVNQAVKQEKF